MKIYKDKSEIDNSKSNLIKPIHEFRYLVDYNGNRTDIKITEDCEIIYPDGSKANQHFDENGRIYSNLDIGAPVGKSNYPAYRLAAIAFSDNPMPYENYKDYQIDHIDPSIPLNNHISNLEIVTRQENMRRAAENGIMTKKYQSDIVNNICQMICDGYSRKDIKRALGVNGQLIDDIRAGRSHTVISEKYLDKGFEYSKYDKDEKKAIIEKVCLMLQQGYRQYEIVEALKDSHYVDFNFVNGIANRRTFVKISKNYKF